MGQMKRIPADKPVLRAICVTPALDQASSPKGRPDAVNVGREAGLSPA